MKAKINLEITPFHVPNKVHVRSINTPTLYPAAPPVPSEPAYNTSMGVPLHDLDAETLDELCNQFCHDVFEKAGKSQPSEARTYDPLSFEDREFLRWIYKRLENTHNENANLDYMRKLRSLWFPLDEVQDDS